MFENVNRIKITLKKEYQNKKLLYNTELYVTQNLLIIFGSIFVHDLHFSESFSIPIVVMKQETNMTVMPYFNKALIGKKIKRWPIEITKYL